MKHLFHFHWTKLLLGALVGLSGALFLTGCTQETDAVFLHTESEMTETEVIAENSQTEMAESDIFVHVCGEVVKSGVYLLPSGSRICDAISAAGGFSSEAAEEYWNLAMELSDGQKIYVPSKEEVSSMEISSGAASDASNGPSTSENSGADGVSTDGRININTASEEQLKQIPGIGDQKARQILEYRSEHGVFSSIEEIMEVPGIKQGTFTQIKEYITVD